jgi:hypothetical protein
VAIALSIYLLIGVIASFFVIGILRDLAESIAEENVLSHEESELARAADNIQRSTGGRIVPLLFAMFTLFWFPIVIWILISPEMRE